MATNQLLNAAESWEKVYTAFEQINFTAYDYDAVKQSLLDYLKLNYPENFNDYIESSSLIALVELFAYVAELLAYRVDLSVHEVLLPTATRKQSILRLAKLISYSATRNLPLRGLVKITSISISEDLRDSQGNSLANKVIRWNDVNNQIWREQFFLAVNKILTQNFGSPFKSFQIDDTVFQQYEIQNVLETEAERSSFRNGVLRLKVTVNGQDLDFELVSADIDAVGVLERTPNPNSYFNILYADDGHGDNSNTTGFMMYIKQGTLQKLNYIFDNKLPNRVLDINLQNINDVDVWVQNVDNQGFIVDTWENVPNVAGINLAFNTLKNQKKYEIETLEDDAIRVIFGDGDFSEIPLGIFNIWIRQSTSGSVTVSRSEITNETTTFLYTSKLGKQESCTIEYSLVSDLQNSSNTEDIEHIRLAAPAVYSSQNRMVNGEDYNSFPLKDPSILRLKSVNRTYAGQSKYLPLNDASGSYQNIKLFGNDLRFYYDFGLSADITQSSSRSLIDDVLEIVLASPGINNLLKYAFYKSPNPLNLAFVFPRTKFIEDSNQFISGIPLQEKTLIQGALDRHWYGEPDRKVLLDVNLSESSSLSKSQHGVVNGDTDYRIYDANLKMVTQDTNTGDYTLVNTPGNVSGFQESVIRQKRFGIKFNPNRDFSSELRINPASTDIGAIPTSDDITDSDINQASAKEETYTIQIIDSIGNFTVYSSVTGEQSPGIIGEVYDNGIISFLIGFPPLSDDTVVIGDSFIINIENISSVYTPSLYKVNLTGIFELIDESDLPVNAESLIYDVNDPIRSWIIIVERTDDINGNLSYWKVITRDYKLIVESPSTKFWFDQSIQLIDPQSKLAVNDMIRILKSNLDSTLTQALGFDQVYDVISNIKYPDGETNFNALSITPSFVFSKSPLEFLRFIGDTDYVYFQQDSTTGRLIPLETTTFLQSLTYVDDKSGIYVRKLGRSELDFMWQHFTPNDRLIDPAPTNIIDAYVLTRGYYSRVQNYLRGLETIEPVPPTSLELQNTYQGVIKSKMISDTMILHSGKLKLLFGDLATPELRASFRIVQATTSKLTTDQIRSKVLDLINSYFSIDNWDFGQSFYATELCALIQQSLANEIASILLVPEFPTNYFGDLFFLRSAPDEIFVSAAKLKNIKIINTLDKQSIRQKP